MICDSQEQKNFLLECVRKYPTTYEVALQCAQTFGQSIQDAQVVKVEEQEKSFPRSTAPQPVVPTPEAPGNGNGEKKETTEAAK